MHREKILAEIELNSKRAGLHGFETVKSVYLESEPFSLQNNLLTPTQKLKRMEARERYQAIIDELYAKIEQKRTLEGAKAHKAAAAVSRL
jgi:long-chain acyl-CoA synthetase